jgi:AcrR family transcriptional regulator
MSRVSSVTRTTILDTAARLATVEGLDGLTIGRLADEVGMSKSGLFAHFGSKEGLQLATVEAAGELFTEVVTTPADTADNGLERLRLLVGSFLRYVEDGTYPGGCFFASAAAELSARTGPVRDRALEIVGAWFGQLVAAVREAQQDGAIAASEDPVQLAFEIDGALLIANLQFVMTKDPEPIERARSAFERIVARAAA